MTPSTISQPLNLVAAQPQQGDGVVAQASVDFAGGDALLGFSGSAWSQSPGQVSLQVWVDGEPAGAPLWMYANQGQMHLALGRTFVYCPSMTPGNHQVMVVAGPTTVTDTNDFVSLTLWELGDGLVATVFDGPGPSSGTTAGVFVKERVETQGGDFLLVSSSGSGWVTAGASTIQTALQFDTANPLILSEVFANNASQHLATVPTDFHFAEKTRGEHLVVLTSGTGTSIDGGDYGHVSVLEWVNPADAPSVQSMNPILQNVQANTQQGDGGTIAQSQFSSNGGALLVRANASVWTQQQGYPLYVGIQIDGTSHGFLGIYANFTGTHMTAVSNDLVVYGIPAGNHTLTLLAEANVITDFNDRVSVVIMEFPAG